MDIREKLAELLRKSPYSIYGDRLKSCFSDSSIKRVAEYLISNGVTAVVRCKDCIYSYEEFGFIHCTFGPYGDCKVPSQFYCAEGKRKENNYGVCNTL